MASGRAKCRSCSKQTVLGVLAFATAFYLGLVLHWGEGAGLRQRAFATLSIWSDTKMSAESEDVPVQSQEKKIKPTLERASNDHSEAGPSVGPFRQQPTGLPRENGRVGETAERGEKACECPLCRLHGDDAPLLFVPLRQGDGLGSTLQQVVYGMAVAAKHGMNFGGAWCPKRTRRNFYSHQVIVADIVQELFGIGSWENLFVTKALDFVANTTNFPGLEKLLATRLSPRSKVLLNTLSVVVHVDRAVLGGVPREAFLTPRFLDALRNQVLPTLRAKSGLCFGRQRHEGGAPTVAVHVRRGDVKPSAMGRYTNNSWYLDTMRHIRAKMPTAEVHLFSSTHRATNYSSSLDELNTSGTHVHLDTELLRTWSCMVDANVLVMAKSSFAHVSALFRKGGCVIWQRYETGKLSAWMDGTDVNDLSYGMRLASCLKQAWPVQDIATPRSHAVLGGHDAAMCAKRPNLTDFDRIPSTDSCVLASAGLAFLRPPVGERWVVAFSLKGDRTLYTEGALANADLMASCYPGWEMRVYADSATVPNDVLQKLRSKGVNVMQEPAFLAMQGIGLNRSGPLKELEGSRWLGQYSRFAIADDLSVARYVVRDVDSRLGLRERRAVDDWICSGKRLHILRDHPWHRGFMMAGGWGSVNGAVGTNFMGRLARWSAAYARRKGQQAPLEQKGPDQKFLVNEVYKLLKNDMLAHDSFHCEHYPATVPFPTRRVQRTHYFAKFNEMGREMTFVPESQLAPPACRGRPDWSYG